MDRASPATVHSYSLSPYNESLRRLRNAGCGLLFRHVRLQPDICTPTSKKRCCQNHCKSNCNRNMHLCSPFPLKFDRAANGKYYGGLHLGPMSSISNVLTIYCSRQRSYPTSVCSIPPFMQSHLHLRGIAIRKDSPIASIKTAASPKIRACPTPQQSTI
jgi:hypothetical protein